MFDYRYLYVFKVRGDGLYKIGISKNWQRRRRQIEDTKSQRVRLKLLIAVPLVAAGFWERRLHRKFNLKRKRLKGVSGGTEFFELNGYDGRIGVRGEVIKYFLFQMLMLTFAFLTIGLLLLNISWMDFWNAILNRI
ncbi:MAG: GIY-YIG nuclease family protein [Bacteroidota bacterium]